MKHLIISFLSPDKKGLVNQLSKIIQQHQGNWQTSSLHHLSGYFTGVIDVLVSEQQVQSLQSDINNIPDFSAQMAVSDGETSSTNKTISLELTANDRAGIIQDISSVIHGQGGNLIKLVSTQENAPHTGQAIFKAKTLISVDSEHLGQLIDALENLADDLMVDVSQ